MGAINHNIYIYIFQPISDGRHSDENQVKFKILYKKWRDGKKQYTPALGNLLMENLWNSNNRIKL